MNAAVAALEPTSRAVSGVAPAHIALLGTGTVGSAVLARLTEWSATPLGDRLSLVYAANSRLAVGARRGLCPDATRLMMARRTVTPPPVGDLGDVAGALSSTDTAIVIDATASDAVAARHAEWLARGIHVVTASKLGQGTTMARWRAIHAACERGGTRYGDSATVGAGLPLLRSIRELQAGGDRIHAIAGLLSGSLAWLFSHYDGLRPFSGWVREACAAGYTEPDPRDDLSGEDVRRKLLILARAAGAELETDEVDVGSLVPCELATVPRLDIDAGLASLDGPLRERFADAWKSGGKLRFIARLHGVQAGRVHARVGLESLDPADPLAGGTGSDNRVAIWSDRYREQPLVIQGPGAGAAVTAAALLDDALAIARA